MSSQLSQRSSLVLLAALAMALACGLLAGGPWLAHPESLAFADNRSWGPWPAVANVLSSLPLTLVGLLGAWALRQQDPLRWPHALQRTYGAFFALAGSSGLLAAAFHLGPTAAAFVAIHVLEAAGCAMLMLAFLAERVNARWGSPQACVAALLAAVAAGLWWWFSGGDLSLLLWMEALPVLLLGAGLLVLPGAYSCNRDWVAMLVVYLLARGLEAADSWLFDTLGAVSGHTLMHLGLAVAAAVPARRLWLQARHAAAAQSSGRPSLRATSLHTSG